MADMCEVGVEYTLLHKGQQPPSEKKTVFTYIGEDNINADAAYVAGLRIVTQWTNDGVFSPQGNIAAVSTFKRAIVTP